MMDTMIYALWIDDKNDDETKDYINRLRRNGIEAHQEFCYEDGIVWLENKENRRKCDAVILDVKCKVKKTDTKDTDDSFKDYALDVYALCEKKEEKFIPWFVFTAGTGYKPEVLESIPRRSWTLSDKKYYSKGSDRGTLIEHIKQLTTESENINIRREFRGIFDICDENASIRLLNIIKVIEKENNYANTSIFNDIRKILAYVVDYGKKHGLFSDEIIVPNDAKKRLGEISKIDPDLVPVYINTAFYTLAEIVNNGSHSAEENEELNKLSVDEDVLGGTAPYLSRASLFLLTSILYWCRSLPTESNAINELSERVAVELADPINAYKGHVVHLQRDEKGFWHYGQCMLMPRLGIQLDETKQVRLKAVEENTHPVTKILYPYFAKYFDVLN